MANFLRVNVVGQPGVGKRTFLNSLNGEDQTETQTTVMMHDIKLNQEISVVFQISSGQNQADATIYIYSDMKSLQNLKVDGSEVKMLLGNKCDLPRTVDLEVAQDFAHKHQMMFTEISALEGRKIQMVLRMLRSKILASANLKPQPTNTDSNIFANCQNFNEPLSRNTKNNLPRMESIQMGSTLEITDQSLLKNLQAWKEDSPTLTDKKGAIVKETPQFDDTAIGRKNNTNLDILNELRDAMESYEDLSLTILDTEQSPQKSQMEFRPKQMPVQRPQTAKPLLLMKHQDDEFLSGLDEEIKRTEESIKYMNERFNKLKSLSPMHRKPITAMKQIKEQAPIYQANLFKEPLPQQKPKTTAPYVAKERPLMTLRVDLGQRAGGIQVVSVFKDDVNASQVAERVLKLSDAASILSRQAYRQCVTQLSAYLETQINQKIKEMLEERHKQILVEQKTRFQIDQLERERRILQGANCDTSTLQTAQRTTAQRQQKRILGNLSVVMGPGRKGQIIVREGDDIGSLVKSFIQLYGLKRDVFQSICESLSQLISQNNSFNN